MENQQNLTPETAEAPPRLLISGSGLPFRWQGFLIYFFMWVYGIILILNAIPVLNGSLLENGYLELAVRYLPNMDGFIITTGVSLILLGTTIIVCRFLLARYLRCALPVFFAVSAADIILPLLFPLGMYIASRPLPLSVQWWELYGVFLFGNAAMRRLLLYPLLIRLVLLVCHAVYYRKRRSDFSN